MTATPITVSDWSLRLAREDDAEEFSEVERDAARLFTREPSLSDITMPAVRNADEYRAIIAQRQSLAAVSDNRVIGFAASRPAGRELHLHELSVACGFQRHGIGSTLLRALQIDARNAGFRAITLDTFRDIAWNAPFYERHGFEIIENLTDHPRLAARMEAGAAAGLPRDSRCAMIASLA